MSDVQIAAPEGNLKYNSDFIKNDSGKNEAKWSQIASSPEFQSLLARKKRFIIPGILFFMVFYFLLPFSTSFYTFLNKPAMGSLSWAFVYGLAQFIMVWFMALLYMKKANRFDQDSKRIREIYKKMEESSR
ncbi:membrane protein [Collibacillus ludicampi]|jgi:uncharacterized membrane protein (DUF485 family)|uniref:Membrane protein n=1 Tax=Collibacillus ludicampi TaxID=2771369 RepID=A0AAV4LBY8_9BACL|nr:DUF485 domain-containing protein [Collibacillus ludicampi]GIM44982.1 membrane protein [Collibacillus ludicampi]